ncbi:MAG TPA: toll/interleukin-1 receptor domain-containing protein [Pyrinomonadaceae bacterium]|nr:toll/interleukin-1 receptor domain-containing protein [Pyrinomonadaceae bacterium]
MSYDVFISHSSKDKETAEAVCHFLEQNKIRCWMAPRDILPGKKWANEISEAISNCQLMLLVFSSNANNSDDIERELHLASVAKIPIIPLRIEDVPMSGTLKYYLGTPHWLDAVTPPFEQHLHKLTKGIQSLLSSLPYTLKPKLPEKKVTKALTSMPPKTNDAPQVSYLETKSENIQSTTQSIPPQSSRSYGVPKAKSPKRVQFDKIQKSLSNHKNLLLTKSGLKTLSGLAVLSAILIFASYNYDSENLTMDLTDTETLAEIKLKKNIVEVKNMPSQSLTSEDPTSNLTLPGKSRPLTLVVKVDKDENLKLNNVDAGNISDPYFFSQTLSKIFYDREEMGVFREGTNEVEKTVFIILPSKIKRRIFNEIIKTVNDAGTDRIVLYVQE